MSHQRLHKNSLKGFNEMACQGYVPVVARLGLALPLVDGDDVGALEEAWQDSDLLVSFPPSTSWLAHHPALGQHFLKVGPVHLGSQGGRRRGRSDLHHPLQPAGRFCSRCSQELPFESPQPWIELISAQGDFEERFRHLVHAPSSLGEHIARCPQQV